MPFPTAAFNDWRRTVALAPLCFNLALEDLRDRYRKTLLGVAWIIVSFALFVGVKVLVFGQMVSTSQVEFGLYVTLGFGLWTYINAMVVDACTAYMFSRAWILGTAIPYPVFLLQAILRNSLMFLLELVVMALAMFWKPTPWSAIAWFAIPGLLAYVVTSVWLAAILAPLCARYRDLHHAIKTSMQLLFFVTPILWMPSISSTLAKIAALNPLTSFIDIVREPLLYDRLPVHSWMVVLAINAIGLAAGMVVYAYTRKRVAYWV
jgi:ABC-type polysaccharide/polyol phosphate export permease